MHVAFTTATYYVRWGCDLVGFVIFSHSLGEAKGLEGFRKIQYCADLASKDGRVLVIVGHFLL
jgi:hypothetical protein